MRVTGTLHAPLHKVQRPGKQPRPAQDQRSPEVEIIRLAADVDYLGADEQPQWTQEDLNYTSRKALRDYWQVAHQARLWIEFRRVDVYV